MKFQYTAADKDNKMQTGEFEAADVATVLTHLASKGMRPVSITATKQSLTSKSLFGSTITTKDKIFLTRYLSLMLSVGTDLFSAINILLGNFDKPAIRDLLHEIQSGLEKGEPFYTTFAKYPNYFSPVFISLVKSGESSGTLDKVFQNLSVTLEREEALRNNVKAAMFYPILLFIMASFILLFLVTFALPRIADVFSTAGVDPPTFSRIVFTLGLFLGKYAWLVFGGFFALLIFAFVFFKRHAGKIFLAKLVVHVPVLNKVAYKIALQRFTSTFSSLLGAGMPILDALEITADVVGSPKLERAVRNVGREGLAKGLTLGEAFQQEIAFPPVVSNLIAISEKTGHLSDILGTMSRFYEEEINNEVKRLVTILEPVMLLGIGGIVGSIALAIIVPVYQLVGQFR